MTFKKITYYVVASCALTALIASVAIRAAKAPQAVRGMTLYGSIEASQSFDKNIVLDFRAPLTKHNHIAFYPVAGKAASKAKNSGVYSYKRINDHRASFIYVAKEGLAQPYYFHFDMTFTQQNAGRFKTTVYKFRHSVRPGYNVRFSSLVYVKTQKGTFRFK